MAVYSKGTQTASEGTGGDVSKEEEKAKSQECVL